MLDLPGVMRTALNRRLPSRAMTTCRQMAAVKEGE